MADENISLVIWSEDANENALSIKHYLENKFTNREVERFFSMLDAFENTVKAFPLLYPLSAKNSEIRRAVLSKQLSVFYIIHNNHVGVVNVLDNRMNPSKWP